MLWLLAPAFLGIAALYASVGLGGGSAYLAVMAACGFTREVMVPIALTCNLLVAGTSAWWYWRGGHVRWELLLPCAAGGIPMAFVGSQLMLSRRAFLLTLGSALFVAAIQMGWGELRRSRELRAANAAAETAQCPSRPAAFLPFCCVSALLGLLAGVTGIGGGIYLIPVLHLWHVADTKSIAALAAWFVTLNSLAGLSGFASRHTMPLTGMAGLAGVVLLGGWLGARCGALRWSAARVAQVTAGILLIAGGQLVWRAL